MTIKLRNANGTIASPGPSRIHIVGDGTAWVFMEGKHGGIAEIDEQDIPLVNSIHWNAHKPPTANNYYAIGRSPQHKGKKVKMHRIILGLVNPKVHYDHEDRNGLNNRRCNLRLATRSQNSANRIMPNMSSRFRGVSRKRYGWQSAICVNYEQRYLGFFQFEEDAARAYDKAAREIFGSFAVVNFKD